MSINSLNKITSVLVQPETSHDWGELSYQSLSDSLISRFNQEGILYCHWKSKSLDGESDIDFLVSGQSLAGATRVLMQLGFKSAVPRWGKNPPGVFHYYGYDTRNYEIVHLHLFTRVLSGERLVKSHWFPFEEMLLKDAYSLNGLIVTSKEAEFVLFILKTFIRISSILDSFRENDSDEELQIELNILRTESDMTEVKKYLEEYCPVVEEGFFLECVKAIDEKASFPRKWLLSQKMRWRLRIYNQSNFISRWFGYSAYLYATTQKKLNGQKGKKSLIAGGAIVAIVGADATGKSTLVEETRSWLRNIFVVNTVHAGKPPSALLTLPINLLLTSNRLLKRKIKASKIKDLDSTSNLSQNNGDSDKQKSLSYAIRAVCLAYDRRSLLLKARRAAANGEIIVSDRYPTNAAGMMDSPRLHENAVNKGLIASIRNWLARVERNTYRQIPPPDIVLRLKVSLEIAKKRNAARDTIDDETYLQQRHQQSKDWYMSGTRTIRDINTDNSLEETISSVKQVVWSNL